MGLDSRDYYQQPPPEYGFGGGPSQGGRAQGRMMVTRLVIINAVVFLLLFNQVVHKVPDQRTENYSYKVENPNDNSQSFALKYLGLHEGLFFTNWEVWQAVTYGFLHGGWLHLFFNMLVLWFFGREVENIYGRYKFLGFYLSSIALSGIIGSYAQEFINILSQPNKASAPIIGASGAVYAVMILYVCLFPRRILYLYFVLPVPAWALAVFLIVLGFFGMFGGSEIAHSVHLAGAACGWIYFKTGWDLSRCIPKRKQFQRFGPQRKVRLHQPKEDNMAQEVDRLLAKINQEGTESLSNKERRTLERASKQYRDREPPNL